MLRCVAILLIVLLTGCIPRIPEKVVIRNPDAKPYDASVVETGEIVPTLVGISQYGLLSAAAYDEHRTHLSGICKHKSRYASGWERKTEFEANLVPTGGKPRNRLKIPGLSFSVWVNTIALGGPKIVIAFKGTDPEPEFGDWYSNLRWFTRLNPFTWDQYQQTRDGIENLIAKIRNVYPQHYQIIAVGHSLGGGLAQHAAYSSRDIKLAYAFATSPVTGSTSLDPRVDGTGVEVVRAYESGEILSILRWGSRQVISLSEMDPQISETRFSFRKTFDRDAVGSGLIGQHSIEQLSCDIICRIENKLPEEECGPKAVLRRT